MKFRFSCDLIYDIFEKVRSGGDQKGGRGKSKQPTAGGQFKVRYSCFNF